MSLVSLIIEALAQLRDVTITSPTSGQALTYNSSTNKWNNTTVSTLSSPLTTKGDIWGYGTTNSRLPVGTDSYALVADSTQATGLNYQAIGTAQPNTKVQLDYSLATDLDVTPGNATWADVISNQTFTVDDGSSVIEVEICGNVYINLVSANHFFGARIVVDSAGTPVTKMVSGGEATFSGQDNLLKGVGTVSITGLSAGSHTIKLQGWIDGGSVASALSCYPVTRPNSDSLSLRVLERKQSTAPSPPTVWATKTTNYTILTTDRAILVDTSGGVVTITLPTAVSATQLYTIKKKTADANAVTVATTSAQTIDGSATYSLATQNKAVNVASDGSNWYVLGIE